MASTRLLTPLNMKTIEIRCKSNNKTTKISIGSSLSEIYAKTEPKLSNPPLVAKVNNRLKGLGYEVYRNKDIEYLDITSAEGHRIYTRTLFFVLSKAVHDLFPQGQIRIDTSISNGYYCNLRITRAVTLHDVEAIKSRMQGIIDSNTPIERHNCTLEQAIRIFSDRNADSKVKLLKTLGLLYTTVYFIEDYPDYYYGPLLTHTGQLTLFGLEKYHDGLLLRVPSQQDPSRLGSITRQNKMFEIFKEHHQWQDLLDMQTIGDFNEAVQAGHANNIINVSEALQEKKIAHIAEDIANRKHVKLILIAGPSSSGKTTTAKRLAIQLLCNGIKPIAISLDDYFLDRTLTPKDEKGDYDFESLYALNLPLLNEQLQQLFSGQTVELPKYDFQTGTSKKSGRKLTIGRGELLILEGIHALNPELTALIPDENKYRVYASALTSILLDHHNYIPTTDNRLLRRIIRDHKYRGTDARETIRRWPSVRKGENKWIFPYQENADAMFNTAMIYELGAIKQQAMPLLEQVPESAEQFSEAHRLAKFLRYIAPIDERELPATSLLREFVGGSSFKY